MTWQSLKKQLQKFWQFYWYEDSPASWIVNIVVALLVIQFLFYPGLSLLLQTPVPLVAVVSESMEHRSVGNCLQYFSDGQCLRRDSSYAICGVEVERRQQFDLGEYWQFCGEWYEQKDISLQDFSRFYLSNGFNRGDVMLIRSKAPENIDVGEIIIFLSGDGIPIIHRVVDVRMENGEYVFQTKGDHNSDSIRSGPRQEVSISYDQYLGSAMFRIPLAGYVKIFATWILAFVFGGV
ncbi:MAG: signal peptidase I [Candidatus Woesearchaeota archaeon]